MISLILIFVRCQLPISNNFIRFFMSISTNRSTKSKITYLLRYKTDPRHFIFERRRWLQHNAKYNYIRQTKGIIPLFQNYIILNQEKLLSCYRIFHSAFYSWYYNIISIFILLFSNFYLCKIRIVLCYLNKPYLYTSNHYNNSKYSVNNFFHSLIINSKSLNLSINRLLNTGIWNSNLIHKLFFFLYCVFTFTLFKWHSVKPILI